MMEVSEIDYVLSSVIDYAIGIIRMRVIDKPILFTVNVQPDVPEHLIGDEMRIKQMLINLLSNACKYCEEGFIRFNVEHEVIDAQTIMLHMEVADSGIGIREENMGKLFSDFIQIGEAVENKSVEGTGLGLAVTKGFAVAMGGDVTVESEHGKGSVFKISIPQKLNVSNDEKFAQIDKSVKQPYVLIYETREIYLESLAVTMNSLGVKYKIATNQSNFYEEILNKKYNFVFVSSFSYDGSKKVFRKLEPYDFTTVLVAEYGELTIDTDNVKTLTMPAHAADIADLLNNNKNGGHKGKKKGSKFIAPSARVLIVDDINTNLIVAQGLMSPYKMTIDLCKSGMEAIDLVQTNEYDIIFMDHMMPEMDGIEAAARIRALDGSYYQKLPLVALTANAVSGMKEMFLKNGYQDFLAKPIDINILDSILERWLPGDKLESFTGAEKTAESELPSFRIEGIDVEAGIYMTGGSAENYLKTLSIFRDDGIDKIDVIREKVESENLGDYAIHVHALKSALASIGAAKMSSIARALEAAAKNNDKTFIVKNNEKFLEELTMLLESIKLAVASVKMTKKNNDGEVDVGFIIEQAGMLKTALNVLDMEKVDEVLALIRTKSDGEIDKILDEISNNVLICEYDTAEELTGTLVRLVNEE
jgi:CheY-like chemotaxis protein